MTAFVAPFYFSLSPFSFVRSLLHIAHVIFLLLSKLIVPRSLPHVIYVILEPLFLLFIFQLHLRNLCLTVILVLLFQIIVYEAHLIIYLNVRPLHLIIYFSRWTVPFLVTVCELHPSFDTSSTSICTIAKTATRRYIISIAADCASHKMAGY